MHERRRATRHEISFDIDLTHPSFGTRRCRAGNISDGGVPGGEVSGGGASSGGMYVFFESLPLSAGSRVTVRQAQDAAFAGRAPSAVQMEVTHVDSDGAGLRFVSRTAEHLWQAAQQALGGDGREALSVRIFHACVVVRTSQLLLLRDTSAWGLPGGFLTRLASVEDHVAELVDEQCGIDVQPQAPLLVTALPGEPPMYVSYVRCMAADDALVTPSGRWREHRWLQRATEIEQLELVDGRVRDLVRQLLPASRGR